MNSLAHYVIVLDFGYPLDPRKRSTIDDLAEFVMQYYSDEPETIVLTQDYSYDSLCRAGFPKRRLLKIRTGQSTTTGLSEGGSYHMLREACIMLERLGAREFDWAPPTMLPGGRPLIRATVVAHALHVHRAIKQGKLLGLQLTTPPQSLPTALYQNAAQWWCRNRPAWYLCEALGAIPLRLAGQL